MLAQPNKTERVLAEKFFNETSIDKKADNLVMLGRLLIAIRDYPEFAFSRQCSYANVFYGKAMYEFLPGLVEEGYVRKSQVGRRHVVVLTEAGKELLDQIVSIYMMFHDIQSHRIEAVVKTLCQEVGARA